ncbi:sugar ABC transporter permease [Pseudarthrobacter sp. PS3-L1]|uniref:carbohydrate ABC transporter permease n=1 Tax=Pseudarthrobacter sp. PS3-L1 TaxID=3046207 RepID=UPI0024BB1F24|nr:sugar ABC transporter permease [Pseudarthrobacter sp. PS3-L1]MDJ0318957.1 sugar ABC transporter permease [Pseudarthrobacter sp. PS3-L1]
MTAVQTQPEATPDSAQGTRSPHRARRRLSAPYILLIPSVAVLVAAMGYPLIWQVITSLQEFGLAQQFGQPPKFVGLQNYTQLLFDSYTWAVVARSLTFCLVCAGATMAIGIALALLMKRVHKLIRNILQTALLLAWAMPLVAAMTVWIWLFDWRRSVVNWVLTEAGLNFQGYNWLAAPLTFYVVAAIIVTWMSVPFVAFSVYAGFSQVSEEVLEAAQMDGATGLQRLLHITIPMIRPVLAIVLLLQVIWDLRVFAQIKMLQDVGSVPSETNLLGTYIYQLGTGSGDFGMSSAVSIFMLVLTLAVSWLYVRRMIREDEAT